MSSKNRSWAAALMSALAMVVLVGSLSSSGCNPQKDQLRPENVFGRLGHQTGQILEPRKCMLRVAILNRPFRDTAINETVWKAADEQALTPESRRALGLNGLRIGLITGEMPPELESILQAPAPHKVEPATFLLDDSDHTLVSVSDSVDQVSLLLNRQNRPYGRDLLAASGYFRVTVGHEGGESISLRITPEIHHGPVKRSFQPISHATPYAPQQFTINDGQQEETLRDLAANLVIEPGQVAVIGCRPEQERSLGSFLFTQAEANGDQKRQKLIMVWASRNQLGVMSEKHTPTDRPVPSAKQKTKPEPRDKGGRKADTPKGPPNPPAEKSPSPS
jgi:hypothetical protein